MFLKKNLRYYLDLAGWSLSELSRRSSVPKSTLQDWVNGSKSVKNVDHIKRVVDAFSATLKVQVSVDTLLYGTPDSHDKADGGILNSLSDGADGWMSGAFEIRIRPLKRGRRE